MCVYYTIGISNKPASVNMWSETRICHHGWTKLTSLLYINSSQLRFYSRLCSNYFSIKLSPLTTYHN